MHQQKIARTGTVLFYLGGSVWLMYALVKYILGWDVSLRQFLPYHLAAVIPGVILKRGSGYIADTLINRYVCRRKENAGTTDHSEGQHPGNKEDVKTN